MRIQVLVLDGVFDTGLAVVLDAFAVAAELAAAQGAGGPEFEVSIVGFAPSVRSAQGFVVPVSGTPDPAGGGWLLVPALGSRTPAALDVALRRPEVAAAGAVLRAAADAGSGIAAACVGTFVLAEAGLLDGRAATTTWWLAPWFRQRYPAVALDEGRMLVAAGGVVTAGAALAHADLALWLIRQASPDLADLVARHLIADRRPAQSAYAVSDHLAHADPTVRRFERWARERLAQGFTLDEAASAIGTSGRTLARRTRRVLGRSPLAFVQDLRVERAAHLLATTELSPDEIAPLVGYADGVTLRALLRRKLGRGIRDLRRPRG